MGDNSGVVPYRLRNMRPLEFTNIVQSAKSVIRALKLVMEHQQPGHLPDVIQSVRDILGVWYEVLPKVAVVEFPVDARPIIQEQYDKMEFFAYVLDSFLSRAHIASNSDLKHLGVCIQLMLQELGPGITVVPMH